MKNIQTEYQNAADMRPIPNDLFTRTKARMRREAVRSKKIRWGILMPVCALVALGSVSAMAYGVYRFTHPVYRPRINSSVPPAVTQKAGAAIGKTDTSGKLAVTIRQTVCDNQNLYLSLEVESTDGTPLQESSEFRKSQLARERFAQTSLMVDGKDYNCDLFRTDDASVPDKASFELLSSGDFTGLNGKSAVLTLKDLTDEVETCEDAGFLFQNLGQLYAETTPEKPQNFIQTGLFEIYADKSLIAPSWTIPAGKQKIKFSSQFPGVYIDNVGFHKTGEYGCQRDVLYISIVPGSRSEVPALKKLCFQNLETMRPVPFEDRILTGNGIEAVGYSSQEELEKALEKEQDRKLTYNGGRVVIALSTFLDHDLSDDARTSDCSAADLNRYRIVKNYKAENVIRCSGTWEIPFTFRFQDTTRKFTPDWSFKTPGGYEVTIQKISLSDLSLSFSGTCKIPDSSNDLLKTDLSPNGIRLILRDGSAVDAGLKFGGGVGADGSFEFEGELQSLVDADEVTAVEIFGSRIPLEK